MCCMHLCDFRQITVQLRDMFLVVVNCGVRIWGGLLGCVAGAGPNNAEGLFDFPPIQGSPSTYPRILQRTPGGYAWMQCGYLIIHLGLLERTYGR
jgi:hypothetical protein